MTAAATNPSVPLKAFIGLDSFYAHPSGKKEGPPQRALLRIGF